MTDREYEELIEEYDFRIKELICRAEDAEFKADQYADMCQSYKRQISQLNGVIDGFKFCITRGDWK